MTGKITEAFDVKVEINQDGLKKLVEAGKLGEFMEGFSAAIGDELKAKITESLAKSAIGRTAVSGISVGCGVDADGDYRYGTGIGPKGPWPPRGFGPPFGITEARVREIIRTETQANRRIR